MTLANMKLRFELQEGDVQLGPSPISACANPADGARDPPALGATDSV